MEKMSAQELTGSLSEKFGLSKADAQDFVTNIFAIVREALVRDRIVKIKGLGTFKLIEVEARESINVNTGERVVIESHDKITFTPDSNMKELVNKPFSQFETVVLNEGVNFDGMQFSTNLENDGETDGDDEESFAGQVAAETSDAQEETSTTDEQSADAQPLLDESIVAVPEEKTDVEQLVGEELQEEPVVEELQEEPVVEDLQEEPVEDEIVVEEPQDTERQEVEMQDNVVSETTGKEIAEESIVDDENTDENTDEEDMRKIKAFMIWWILALVIVGVGGYAAGYYWGKKSVPKVVVEPKYGIEKTDTAKTATADSTAQVTTAKPATADSTAKSAKPTTADNTVATTAKPVTATNSSATAKSGTPDYKKYEEMDPRIQHGAYAIVGTAQTVKVKPGNNLARISRAYLGEGMECYVETYNGLKGKQLEVGQEIKIPKLVTKKSLRKKQTDQ